MHLSIGGEILRTKIHKKMLNSIQHSAFSILMCRSVIVANPSDANAVPPLPRHAYAVTGSGAFRTWAAWARCNHCGRTACLKRVYTNEFIKHIQKNNAVSFSRNSIIKIILINQHLQIRVFLPIRYYLLLLSMFRRPHPLLLYIRERL